MKKSAPKYSIIGSVSLVGALILGSCTVIYKPTQNTLNSTSGISSTSSTYASVVGIGFTSAESNASIPVAYRIDTATIENAKTNTDDSLIGTSGIKHSYSYKDAIADGALVGIADANEGFAVFNTSKFDAFIKNPTSRSIWIFHYILYNGKLSIHEMALIQHTGTGYTDTSYDPYTGGKGVTDFDHIVKQDWPDSIRYGEADKGQPDDMSARIMSFNKVSVYS